MGQELSHYRCGCLTVGRGKFLITPAIGNDWKNLHKKKDISMRFCDIVIVKYDSRRMPGGVLNHKVGIRIHGGTCESSIIFEVYVENYKKEKKRKRQNCNKRMRILLAVENMDQLQHQVRWSNWIVCQVSLEAICEGLSRCPGDDKFPT